LLKLKNEYHKVIDIIIDINHIVNQESKYVEKGKIALSKLWNNFTSEYIKGKKVKLYNNI
jgi:hypothetical protein